MNSRTSPPESHDVPRARLLPWLGVALVIAVGAVLAFIYGPRIAPLLDLTK